MIVFLISLAKTPVNAKCLQILYQLCYEATSEVLFVLFMGNADLSTLLNCCYRSIVDKQLYFMVKMYDSWAIVLIGLYTKHDNSNMMSSKSEMVTKVPGTLACTYYANEHVRIFN